MIGCTMRSQDVLAADSARIEQFFTCMQVQGNTEGPMQAAAVEGDVHLPGDASLRRR